METGTPTSMLGGSKGRDVPLPDPKTHQKEAVASRVICNALPHRTTTTSSAMAHVAVPHADVLCPRRLASSAPLRGARRK
jgi:hypothetical protein